jgi:hypothetical protein
MALVLYVYAGKEKPKHRIEVMEKKIFWIIFILLGLVADFALPLLWSLVATIPIAVVSWWIAYRSDWF